MKTIRKSVWETNSSSTHSVAIDTSYTRKSSVDGLEIEGKFFGWEFVRFNDFVTKASYFWALVHNNQNHPLFDRMVRLSRKYNFELLQPRTDQFWYVDNGTEHYSTWIKENPQLDTDEGLMDFMISESSWIFLGNDNDDDPPNFRLTQHQLEKAPYFLTLLEDKTLRYALRDLKQSTINEYASAATYNYLEPDAYTDGRVKILTIDNETIQAVIEKYDYKSGEYIILSNHILHYEIETNTNV